MQIHNLFKQASAMHLYLAELRDKSIQTDRERFRQNMQKLGFIVGYEISKSFEHKKQKVITPLGTATAQISKTQPVIVAILRASLPFFNGFLDVFPQADSGFIGSYRVKEAKEIEIKTDYVATGPLDNETVILVDPMLATGKSLVESVKILTTANSPREIHIASVVAAPEGINYLLKNLTVPSQLWTCAIDEKLNDHAYIVPGLGDAGDLCFGQKI